MPMFDAYAIAYFSECIHFFYIRISGFVSTAQVPDDEQFVPDFQPDSCEYLRFNTPTPLPCTLEVQ